jgi:hypothetical protein
MLELSLFIHVVMFIEGHMVNATLVITSVLFQQVPTKESMHIIVFERKHAEISHGIHEYQAYDGTATCS